MISYMGGGIRDTVEKFSNMQIVSPWEGGKGGGGMKGALMRSLTTLTFCICLNRN